VKFFEEHIARHHSMQLIGMKRVGINNLIQHFFAHKNYPSNQTYLFVMVDLNNLVEREAFPFWQLTLKRIVDAVRDAKLPPQIEKKVTRIFENCIQYENILMTYDGIRESLHEIVNAGIYPVIFFTRFDRITNLLTEEFFDNLKGIHDAAQNRISYVFTSYRKLQELAPLASRNKTILDYLSTHYIKPAGESDSESIIRAFEQSFQIQIPEHEKKTIVQLAAGHVQYLQLSLTHYYEAHRENAENQNGNYALDERISMQSDELWESLGTQEQHILKKVHAEKIITSEDERLGAYLWNTGMIKNVGKRHVIFSPLFDTFIESRITEKKAESLEFTKKEHLLFTCLLEHVDTICEREIIIEHVWPEDEDYGISDWSIDKLVERLRIKLAKKHPEYEIITVRTRGYKMMKR
jgi:DNA-binding winged helix-turn-helix (wHTH) protein